MISAARIRSLFLLFFKNNSRSREDWDDDETGQKEDRVQDRKLIEFVMEYFFAKKKVSLMTIWGLICFITFIFLIS